MRYYIVKISTDGQYEKFPTIYFTRNAAQKICDWNNSMYSGYWKVCEE